MATTYLFEDLLDDRASRFPPRFERAGPFSRLASLAEAESAFRATTDPAAVVIVVVGPGGWSENLTSVCRAAQRGQVASMALAPVETPVARLAEADEWMTLDASPEELAARLARLRRGANRPSDHGLGRLLAMVVHDLRSPLQLLSLSLQSIASTLTPRHSDLDEDVTFLHLGLRRIERILNVLSDHERLAQRGPELQPEAASPRTLAGALLTSTTEPRKGEITLDVQETCPVEARLDPWWAGLALRQALGNAEAAADGAPIRLVLRGAPRRWIVDLIVERPPPPSFTPFVARSHEFERLVGSHAQRRGLDLAIAAAITEEFGGQLSLDRHGTSGTILTLDWPADGG